MTTRTEEGNIGGTMPLWTKMAIRGAMPCASSSALTAGRSYVLTETKTKSKARSRETGACDDRRRCTEEVRAFER